VIRRHLSLLSLALALPLLGCGGDDQPIADDEPLPPDAAASADVVEVDCASATAAATVTTVGFAYEPASVTVATGEVVKFTPQDGHDAMGQGNAIDVPLAGEGCYRFDAAGSFGFFCSPHGFSGTVEVTP
jgi:plastocyanin